jgi:hypothetical protein
MIKSKRRSPEKPQPLAKASAQNERVYTSIAVTEAELRLLDAGKGALSNIGYTSRGHLLGAAVVHYLKDHHSDNIIVRAALEQYEIDLRNSFENSEAA